MNGVCDEIKSVFSKASIKKNKNIKGKILARVRKAVLILNE